MSVWREVQEALYQRWADAWGQTTPYCFGTETFDPPDAPHCRFSAQSAPGQQGSLGRVGNRRWDRRGRLFVQVRQPPGLADGDLSDLGELARGFFEGCRFNPHDVRFGVVDVGDVAEAEEGRWNQVLVQGGFDYEEVR